MKDKRAMLIEGEIGPTLIKLTIPMIVGIFSMVGFNLADTFFVGQLGTTELAAISFSFPVVFIITSLTLGLGIGASALISRAIGEGDHHKVQHLTTNSLMLSLVLIAAILVAGLLTIEPVFRLLGATPLVMPFIKEYMQVWYFGIVFVVVPMVGNSAIRATGDTMTPSMIMMVAVFVNIGLDPLLIFGLGPFPKMGIAGAAVATVISRAVTMCVSLWVLYYREKMLSFERLELTEILTTWRQILYIGLPAGGTNMLIPFAAGVITSFVAQYGTEAVAAYGVASRLDMFALTVVMALSTVLAPFIGQNWGANRIDRVRLAVKYSQGFSMIWGVAMLILFATFSRSIGNLFNDHPLIVENIVNYMWIVPLGYGLQGVLLLSNSTLNVLNKPMNAAGLVVFQAFVLQIPLAYLGSKFVGLTGIFSAIVVANIIAGFTAYWWLRHVLSRS